MTSLYPSTPEFTGALYMPSRFEGSVLDLEIDGDLPKEINGTFYQVSPDPQYPPMMGDDIFFNGDGAVMAFRFKGGRVNFQRRYVETERLLAQRAAGRSLHGIYRNVYSNDPLVAGKSNTTSNTNVLEHAGVLLAMKEDSLPYALKPDTLETVGLWDFNGQLKQVPFTAHPKVDYQTGDLIAFGCEAKGDSTPDIVYYEIDKTGRKTKEVWIEGPYAAMIHDFAVTKNFVIFPLMPLTSDVERQKKGGRHFEWQPELEQMFGVLNRNGSADTLRTFTLPNGFQGHTLNAYDEDGKIYIDMPITQGNIFYFFPQADGFVPSPESLRSQMMRVKIDMTVSGNSITTTPLTQFPCEFPRVDYRFAGIKHRHGFFMALNPTLPYAADRCGPMPFQFFNQLCHLDIKTGKCQFYFADNASCFQEPIFVPRSADAPEGDGYVMALVNHLDGRPTDLVILDALNFDKGPVATVKIPMRLRMSLHGNWSPANA